MEKVRIGNDIEVKYTVLRDGLPETFVGATNIAVEVRNEAYGKVIPSTFSIVDNVVNVVLDAKDCVLCGKHRVTLSYNRGNDITIDALAFELVQFTSQTGGTEIVGVEIVTVNISGDIGIAIPDNNKIDLDGLNSNIDRLHFNPNTLIELANIGDVRYSPESKTLEVKVSDTVSIQLGQEMQTRVKNNAGVQINNGQMVYIDSASGANPLAKIASTTDANIAQRTFGMATENIASNGFGAITTEGLVRDVNTAAFTEGDMLWLGVNGTVTNIEPVAPTPKISVGMVLRSNVANGVIYVKIRAISRNQKLSDVYAPTLTGGDVLRWNSATLRFETFNVTTALAGKADLVGGKIPTSQLPSYVDDVLEYTNLAAFPATGETGKIYVALDTNLTYRWSGTAYIEISKSLALGETSDTAYRGDRGKTAYDHSQATGNAHGTTASQIPNTPAGTIAATNVQAAINELDGDVAQVRADLNEVETDLNNIVIDRSENVTYIYSPADKNSVVTTFFENGTIGPNGKPTTSSTYRLFILTINKKCSVYFDYYDKSKATYIAFSYISNGIQSLRFRKNSPIEDTLPTINSKVALNPGDVVYLSMSLNELGTSSDRPTMHLDYINVNSKLNLPSLFSKDDSKMVYLLKSSNAITIYMHKAEFEYIRYIIDKQTKPYTGNTTAAEFYDTWGLKSVDLCVFDGYDFIPINKLYKISEAELVSVVPAYNGAMVAVGGSMHGYDNIIVDGNGRNVRIAVNNVYYEEDSVIDLVGIKSFEIYQRSLVYQAGTNENPYAEVYKKMEFTNAGVVVETSIKFLRSILVNNIYSAMQGCYRRVGGDPEKPYLTNTAVKSNDQFHKYVISDGWDILSLKTPDPLCEKITLYGEKNIGFSSKVLNPSLEATRGFFVSTNNVDYNKIYYQVKGAGTVNLNDQFKSKILIQIV